MGAPDDPRHPEHLHQGAGLGASAASLVPEAFVDTPVVNGVAYPYLTVDPKAYRFRILDGANDRYWNLQMYCSAADKPSALGLYNTTNGTIPATGANTTPMWAGPDARVPANAAAGEVPMVQAARTAGFPADWPTDGRAGGVPDPAARAGSFLQIGTESGVLPNLVDVRNGPVGYNYNRRDIVVLNIADHGLLLGPAERADVVYDFSKAKAMGCNNVVLYNDAPSPVPAFDPRNDYYTNNPDQTDSGGTPSTLPGYGPNTRTIMQFRISDATPEPFSDAALRTAVPQWFAATQNHPIVPETRYATAYPGDPIGQSNVYARIQDNSLTFPTSTVGDVASLTLGASGSGYAPVATVTGGGGTGAQLVPVIGASGTVTSVTIVNPGSGFTSTPTVQISTPIGGTAATARASVRNGVITAVSVQNRGQGYTASATLTIAAPPTGNTAAGTATVNMNTGAISAVTLTEVGNGYTAAPAVAISAPLYVGGVQATASTTLATGSTVVKLADEPKAIQELFEMDYGRMNATLGVELPFTNSTNQTTLPMGYTEPTTEFMKPSQVGTQIGTRRDGTEIWKITHNGVDTHTIHFHLSDVQLINRVGWDGAIRPPDDNELGWKESVRMNPLEDAIIAMRPATPELPFKIGDSVRAVDPTMPLNHQMSTLDPLTGQATTYTNSPVSFGWEYVWHCHLLGHEENDMMRPVDFAGSPDAPTIGTAVPAQNGSYAGTMTVKWSNNANWQLTNFVVQRADDANFSSGVVKTLSDKSTPIGGQYVNWQGGSTTLGGALGTALTFTDNFTNAATQSGKTFYYRVRAESANGYSAWSAGVSAKAPTFVAPPAPPAAPVLGAVTNGSTQASIVVSTASVLNGGTFTKYQYSLDAGATWADFAPSVTSRTASPLVVTGLTNGTAYSLTVRGVSSGGNGSASNAVALAPVVATVAAPTGIVVTSTANSGSNARIVLSWTGLRASGASAGVSYVVRYSTGPNGTGTVASVNVAGNTGGTNYTTTITNGTATAVLAHLTTYYLQIQAVQTGLTSSAWTPQPSGVTAVTK